MKNDTTRVLHFFEEISAIPRRSFITAPIAEYLCGFAKARGLSYLRDAADNVIIKKAASAGFENRSTVILQAHTDMVFVKADPDAPDDQNAPLRLRIEGDTLSAVGTSLGADDGIGMAYMLAILDDDTLSHPAIEALFTSNEEVGLLGAAALDASALCGRMLINLDSDEEGIFTVGCAGGSTATLTLPFQKTVTRPCRTLTLTGLPGGHSGADIHKGIANAILLLLSLLSKIEQPIALAEISGGEASNAIPAFASVRFFCEAPSEKITAAFAAMLKEETQCTGDAALTLSENGDAPCMDIEKSRALIHGILGLPNGILAMEKIPKGLPKTSLNLGKIETQKDRLVLRYALRSSVDACCRSLENELKNAAEALLGQIEIDGEYPAWEYRERSPLRDVCLALYRRRYGKDATVSVIHAGLECGVLAAKISGLDSISFGPNNRAIHTADEALLLSSAEAVYEYLTEVLSALR